MNRPTLAMILAFTAIVNCKHDPAESADQPAAPAEAAPTEPALKPPKVPARLVEETERKVPVFDFMDNRHLAHLIDSEGALLMDMGAANSLKYIQGGWNSTWLKPRVEAGVNYAYTRGVGASVRFPLIAANNFAGKTKDWKLAIRLKPVGKQRCDLFLRSTNGEEKRFASLTSIEDGWKTYVVTIPDGLDVGQEHTLRIHFSHSQPVGSKRSAAAVDWIRVGPGVTKASPTLPVFDPKSSTASVPANGGLIWYTMLGKNAELRADFEGAITASTDTKTPTFVTTDSKIRADLGPLAGTPLRIAFFAQENSKLVKAEIVTKPGTSRPVTERPQIVLVWIIDTLRADHLKLYNPMTDVKTPRLDAFAKDSALFKSATVQGNSSLPSSASVFTAAYAPNHKLTTEKAKLPKDHVLFGEAFKNAGWTTGLFSSNGYVSKGWGFARGFDKNVNPIRENRPSDAEYLWPETKNWVEEQLKANPSKKLLVYLNPVDPHVPYDPPKEQLALYDSRTGKVGQVSPRGTGQILHDMAKGKLKLSADEAKYMHALYQGEISYNDLWFGKLLDDLKALGVLDKTMIIVTSDHGEEFNEYGRFGHGVSLNQELIDVPFLVYFQPWTKGGITISDDIETIDMLPTVLDAAGIPLPESAQGRSLVQLILEPLNRHPRPAFSYHNAFLRSARLGQYKYQLFHGDKDPVYALKLPAKGEPWDAKDIGDANPVAHRMMRDLMAFQVALDTRLHKSVHGSPNNHSAALAELLDDLAK